MAPLGETFRVVGLREVVDVRTPAAEEVSPVPIQGLTTTGCPGEVVGLLEEPPRGSVKRASEVRTTGCRSGSRTLRLNELVSRR